MLHPSIDSCIHGKIDKVEDTVSADRLGLPPVLGNRLSNAGRFANRKVTIRAAAADLATTIDVDDDGNGISESDRERVFEPFVRLDDHGNAGAPRGGARPRAGQEDCDSARRKG